jgi:hypothetical protein
MAGFFNEASTFIMRLTFSMRADFVTASPYSYQDEKQGIGMVNKQCKSFKHQGKTP